MSLFLSKMYQQPEKKRIKKSSTTYLKQHSRIKQKRKRRRERHHMAIFQANPQSESRARTAGATHLKALGAETHARGDATRPAAVRHEIGRPHQPARRRIVVSADCKEEKMGILMKKKI